MVNCSSYIDIKQEESGQVVGEMKEEKDAFREFKVACALLSQIDKILIFPSSSWLARAKHVL